MNNLTASVIIPAYSLERVDDVARAIESVENQTHTAYEIIIPVDHNMELVDVLGKRLHQSVRLVLNNGIIGGAETRNTGIREASGDVVAFLDDDARAEPNWLHSIMLNYDNPAVMAVGGKTISCFPEGRPKWFPEELDWMIGGTWKGHPEEKCEVRNLIGPNMSFRRSVCSTVGLMRTELGAMPKKARAGDETEFYIRLKHLIPEGKVMFEPKAIVHHTVYPWKMTASYLGNRAFSDGYWKQRTKSMSVHTRADNMSTEKGYLKYLLTDAIPGKIIRPSAGNLSKVAIIAGSALCFGAGCLKGIACK